MRGDRTTHARRALVTWAATSAIALAALAAMGCRERRSLRWEIDFEDGTVAARSVLVLAELRRGICADDGEVLYAAELGAGDATSVPTLAEGTYAFAAIARDASCVEIASGCAEVTLPIEANAIVRTVLRARAGGAPVCDDCVAGRCEGELDAGPPDAGPTDASVPDDAPPITGPPPPRLVAPWNGLATGSLRARDGSITRAPLRPRFAWAPVATASRYELQLDDGCAAGAPETCDFAAARARTLSSTASARPGAALWIFEPGEDLLPAAATRGARVHWRVRSCDAAGACGAWSAEVRWMDVGRDRHDVDGDGRGDLLIGAPGTDDGGTDAGAIHLHLGTGAGFAATETPLPLPSRGAGAWLGSAIALGDLDGDGLADAIVSASDASIGGSGAGALIVMRGSATGGLDVAGAITVAAPDAPYARHFGDSVAIVDDTDGDGFRDVLVGAPRDAAAGRAYLFRGDPSALLRATPAARLDDPDASASGRFGATVAPAYDVDGDGDCDLLIGAPFAPAGGIERGRAWLFRASAPAAPIALDGPADDRVYFGFAIAGAGDVDEDGYADVAIGAPYEDLEAGADSDEGRVYVFGGGAGGLDATRVLARLARSTEYDYVHAGWSIAAGDVDGDGHVDLVVPEPAIDQTEPGPDDRGLLAVHRGRGDGTFDPVATLLYPDVAQSYMEYGRSVAAIDANGDGRAEIVGGSHRWNSSASDDAGRVWWHDDPFGADLRGVIAGPAASGSSMFGWALPGSIGRLEDQLDM